MAGRVHVQRKDGVGWIVFDHPERRNAMTAGMWTELVAGARDLDADDAVRVIIMRGAGETAFVSGADISQFQPEADIEAAKDAGGDARAERIDPSEGNVFEMLQSIETPLIAMIHGYCIGGGLAIALCADMRYAADDARFAIPAARLGVGYGYGAVAQLERVVGGSNAVEVLMTARRYDASEALSMGLVNRVHPKGELEEHVTELAMSIAANAPLTVRAVKLAARALRGDPAAEAQRAAAESEVEAAIRDCFESQDFAEGVKAFLGKRSPRFEGR